jgi:hypothetical protein
MTLSEEYQLVLCKKNIKYIDALILGTGHTQPDKIVLLATTKV